MPVWRSLSERLHCCGCGRGCRACRRYGNSQCCRRRIGRGNCDGQGAGYGYNRDLDVNKCKCNRLDGNLNRDERPSYGYGASNRRRIRSSSAQSYSESC
jgi:hypothetical protein